MRFLVTNGKKAYDLGPAVSGADREVTIEGPSTRTISWSDQAKTLLRSGLFDANSDGKLDGSVTIDDENGIRYRMASLSRGSSRAFSAIFEDEAVAKLRAVRGVRRPKSSSGHVAFARSLCREAGVEMRTPQGVRLIPSTNSSIKARKRQEDRDRTFSRGIGSTSGLTVKGKKPNDSQVRLAETALARAAFRKAGPKATLALMMALIVESEIRNLGWSDGANRSRGPLQARPGVSAGVGGKVVTEAQSNDVEYMVDCFLLEPGFASRGGAISLSKKHPDWTAGTIAWNVEMPAAQYRSRYDEVADEARKWVAAFGGAAPSTERKVSSTPSREPEEDSWEAMKRIAEERGYRVFAARNVIYYGREQDFIRARPVAEITDSTEGVEEITWEWTPGKKTNLATLSVRADGWAIMPGSVVSISEEGPASGRWLVSRLSRSEFSNVLTVDLRRGTELLKPGAKDSATTIRTTPDDGAGSVPNTFRGSPLAGVKPASAKTHDTGGLGWPAYDYMAKAGTACVAPESGKIYKLSGKDPRLGGPPGGPLGYSIYLRSVTGINYYMTHLDNVKVRVGQSVEQGEKIAVVANGPASWSSPHVHLAMERWRNWA